MHAHALTGRYYDPTMNTQKLAEFIGRNKDALMPDYILVSEPDGRQRHACTHE